MNSNTKFFIFTFIVQILFQITLASEKPVSQSQIYGAPFTQERIIPLKTVLSQPKDYSAIEFLTEGVVSQVCVKKGCWLEVRAENQTEDQKMRVTFKDYGFFVPKEILNKPVRLQGRLVEKTLSVKEQKHFLKDAKASDAEIAAVTEPKAVLELIATSVQEKPTQNSL